MVCWVLNSHKGEVDSWKNYSTSIVSCSNRNHNIMITVIICYYSNCIVIPDLAKALR